MKFKKYLQEEYVDYLTSKHKRNKNDKTPIFVNPSLKEMNEIGSAVRWIISFKNKKIWAWNGNQLVHWEVAEYLQEKGEIPIKSDEVLDEMSFWNDHCAGEGYLSAGKISPFYFSDYFRNILSDLKNKKITTIPWYWWHKEPSWLKSYFESSLIEAMKKHYGNELYMFKDLDEEYITSFKAKDISWTYMGGHNEI
jgi:hypothetical protein